MKNGDTVCYFVPPALPFPGGGRTFQTEDISVLFICGVGMDMAFGKMAVYNNVTSRFFVKLTNGGDPMQLCIRAHDLSVTGTEEILARITQGGIDGVQMVCYKAYPQIPYAPGGITPGLAAQIGSDFAQAGKTIPLIGAYFNPVHSSQEKRELGFSVFANYLRVASQMGSGVVASETGM